MIVPSFAEELGALINKWRQMPGVTDDELLQALVDAVDFIEEGEDDD